MPERGYRIHAAALSYFDAVRRARSIRGAARGLNVASSAVNRQVLALEAEVGEPLFERLRAWRAGVAKEQSVPAYIIFGDATLRGIALSEPTSMAELSTISGIGEKKLEAYGEALLALVNA